MWHSCPSLLLARLESNWRVKLGFDCFCRFLKLHALAVNTQLNLGKLRRKGSPTCLFLCSLGKLLQNRGSKWKHLQGCGTRQTHLKQFTVKNWFRQTLTEMFRNKIKAGGTNWLNPKFFQLLVNSPIQKTLEKDALSKAKGPCQPSSKLWKHNHYRVGSPFFLLKK